MMKNQKQRLFEMMKKLDPTFRTIEENIEPYLSEEEMQGIMKGYFEAAIWTEEERLKDEAGASDDSNGMEDEDDDADEIEKLIRLQQSLKTKPFQSFVVDHIEPDSKIQAYLDVKNFIKMAGQQAVAEALNTNDPFRLGMDIWLTRNGHGSGFFDHSYEFEQQLMTAAKNLREVDLYVTDNMKLAFSNA